jgi:hypothetical protein
MTPDHDHSWPAPGRGAARALAVEVGGVMAGAAAVPRVHLSIIFLITYVPALSLTLPRLFGFVD